MKNIFFALITLISTVQYSNGQIVVDQTPTAVDLVTNTLIGPGLVTSNITYSGNALQKAYFDGSNCNIGLAEGVFLSSGDVNDAVLPNQPTTGTFGGPGDPDLLTIAQSVTSNPDAGLISSSEDAAILEFDFVPDGDVVIFNFVFASEEYTQYINSQYNDAFGFFISGPGYAGPYASPAAFPMGAENLAIVPGTNDPITISTIYVDPFSNPTELNGSYYIGTPVNHSFNGFTVPIEIRFDVICDSTYHFKFAVSDCSDDFLDTGVFLEGGSFQSLPVDLSLETNIDPTLYGDSVILEGCGTNADFVFTRPSCQSGDSLYVTVEIAGTADNGVDYTLIPDSVLFLPDSTSVIIPFFAFQDGVFEGFESVILTVTNILPNGDTIVTVGEIWLYDQPNVSIIAQDTSIFCLVDSTDIFTASFDGVPPYSYTWDNYPDTTDFLTVPTSVNGTTDYYVDITDACGFTDRDTLTVIVNETLLIDSLTSVPSGFVQAPNCLPSGIVQAFVSGQTEDIALAQYNWTGPNANPGVINVNGTAANNLPPGWYYFSVTDDVCSKMDSIEVFMDPKPIAQMSAVPAEGCTPLNVLLSNTSQNATSYYWDFGNLNTLNSSDLSNQSQTYTTSSQVMLIAYDDYFCGDTTYLDISVIVCGCMDPIALNYNPDAVEDDGGCIYPSPIVIPPNVFTPNGDLDNDLYFLDLTHTVHLELVIVNRWGAVMFELNSDLLSSSQIIGWDGRDRSGNEADEGTYFYTYVATGINGDQVDGHGFLQLVRK